MSHNTGVKFLLKPFELAYRAVAAARRKLYRSGLLRATKLPRPVVSVGNLAFGGTGKTPLVMAIASELIRRGYRVAVLTRGYGRRGDGGAVAGEDPGRYGDEPVLIARAAPRATVLVGADRYASGVTFLRDHDCDVFLLDDGFQHLQLARDLDIVIDSPGARWLRESRGALNYADLVVVRDAPAEFSLTIVPKTVVAGAEERPPESLRGAKAFLFSGLADNDQFFDFCRRLGVVVAGTHGFPDHHRYTLRDLAEIRAAAGEAMILTTEKDAVKIQDPTLTYLRVVAEVRPRDAFFDRVTQAIRKR